MTDLRTVNGDQRLIALLRWRDELIDSGVVSRSSFKEAHVRLVLRSGRTDAAQIRQMLPATVAQHAEEMATILRTFPPAENGEEPDHDADRPERAEPMPASESGFAPYRFRRNDHDVSPIQLRRLAESDDSDGELQVSWPPFVADNGQSPPSVIYRLVSTDGERGYSPDHADLVAVTSATAVNDGRTLDNAVRHLQVWVNAGGSDADALAAQPILHASGAIVCTLANVEIRDESASVIGQWTTVPGVGAVRVYRIPAELAEHDGPAFEIDTGQTHLTGFIDADVEPGRHYVYRMRCEVEVDDVVRLSEAVEARIQVAAVREPVTDLTLTMERERDDVAISVEWTPPRFGQVLIFRTPEPPSADAQTTDLDESVLEQVGLNHESQLIRPVLDRLDDNGIRKSVMPSVSWPDDWNRAYFTPVTVLDGRARLGAPISTVRTGLINDVALMEYCSKQVLTFDWPHGAASVLVYIAPRGHDPSEGLTGRNYQIARADYERSGGMHFVDKLPIGGCSLHLLPVAFTGGRRVLGAVTSIDYTGLLRLSYQVDIARDSAGLPLSAALTIRAEARIAGSPPFVLVNNPKRIPLSASDGRAVDVFQADPSGTPITQCVKEFQWSSLPTIDDAAASEMWLADVRGLQGWVRLFANVPPQRLRVLALLDPPVEALRLTAGPLPQ